MRKILFSKVVMGCLMVAAVLTACSKDNDQKTDEKGGAAKADMAYWFDVNEELLGVADITVSYYYNNNLYTEQMTTTHWERHGSLQTFPGKLGYSVEMTKKAGLEKTKDSYQLLWGVNIVGKKATDLIPAVRDKDGKLIGNLAEGRMSVMTDMNSATVRWENLDVELGKIKFSKIYNIDTDGNAN